MITPFEALQKARGEYTKSINFVLPLKPGNEDGIKATLTLPDYFAIKAEADRLFLVLQRTYEARGWAGIEPDQNLIKEEMEAFEEQAKKEIATAKEDKREEVKANIERAKKSLVERQPKNYAEQAARAEAQRQSIIFVIPRYLKVDGKPLCSNVNEEQAMADLITTNADLYLKIIGAYLEASQIIAKDTEEAKNS